VESYFITNLTVEKLPKGPFKSVLIKRRCLIPADGFYEWKPVGAKKMPFRFTLKDDSLFSFAGIYDDPDPDSGPPVRTFTIFTTEANPLVAPVHHRMPAILPPDLEDPWLDASLTDVEKVIGMLRPYPPDKMKSYAVSTALNSGKIDTPDLIKPVE
jgi:putative SOS response-associated peptidase YedK